MCIWLKQPRGSGHLSSIFCLGLSGLRQSCRCSSAFFVHVNSLDAGLPTVDLDLSTIALHWTVEQSGQSILWSTQVCIVPHLMTWMPCPQLISLLSTYSSLTSQPSAFLKHVTESGPRRCTTIQARTSDFNHAQKSEATSDPLAILALVLTKFEDRFQVPCVSIEELLGHFL